MQGSASAFRAGRLKDEGLGALVAQTLHPTTEPIGERLIFNKRDMVATIIVATVTIDLLAACADGLPVTP